MYVCTYPLYRYIVFTFYRVLSCGGRRRWQMGPTDSLWIFLGGPAPIPAPPGPVIPAQPLTRPCGWATIPRNPKKGNPTARVSCHGTFMCYHPACLSTLTSYVSIAFRAGTRGRRGWALMCTVVVPDQNFTSRGYITRLRETERVNLRYYKMLSVITLLPYRTT